MLTEEEAKGKWCPFARVALDYGEGTAGSRMVASANRGWADLADHLNVDSRCIASQCMAWRPAVLPHQRNLPNPADAAPAGYCGLAGKPTP